MKKILHALWVLLFCFSTSSAQTIDLGVTTNGIDFKGNYTIEGELALDKSYGPPNYGETPEIDKVFYSVVLRIPSEVTLRYKESGRKLEAKQIQIMGNDMRQLVQKLKSSKRYSAKLHGSFFHSHTGSHVRKIIMDIGDSQVLLKEADTSGYRNIPPMVMGLGVYGRNAYAKEGCEAQSIKIYRETRPVNDTVNDIYKLCLSLYDFNNGLEPTIELIKSKVK